MLIADANQLQHIFAHERQATLWRAIPVFEELLSTWEARLKQPRFASYQNAIERGLEKLSKYYNKFDEKSVYVLALGESQYLIEKSYMS